MSDYLSDSYRKDMKAQIKYIAQLSAAAEDFALAAKLYDLLFELQLRDEGTTKQIMEDLTETASARMHAMREGERLRLVPRMGPICVSCDAVGRMLDAGGMCATCRTIKG